jgi:hypothetical protein
MIRIRFFYFLLIIKILAYFLITSKLKDINTCKNFNHNNLDFKLENFMGSWIPLMKSQEIPFFSACDQMKFAKIDGSLKAEVTSRKNQNASPSINLKLSETKNKNSYSFTYLGINNILTIIDTDYSTFAVLYTCTDIFFTNMYNIVILSKNDKLPDAKLKEIKENIQKTTGKVNLISINQKNCIFE